MSIPASSIGLMSSLAPQIMAQRAINNENSSQISDTPHSFQTFLDAYLNLTNTAGRMELQAQHVAIEYALGYTDDMLAVILAQEAAHTALNFTVQVTSRIIQAYQEIMRMQM